ncbi:hypothetical protein PCANC_20184 [Puccinia coronata f. sp. avenae]|uniref:Uncharacterized protein n=1 Tax=Puccinia coronata f. sp. avenae TaxID=200324 RepID=A0A2N5TW32_9BASI|nr:hypothetical protein PCANC_20184 [Puccinia coronata f. sp. avenae]
MDHPFQATTLTLIHGNSSDCPANSAETTKEVSFLVSKLGDQKRRKICRSRSIHHYSLNGKIFPTQPPYVRIFGKNIPTAPEGAERSSGARAVANQDPGPSLKEEHKQVLRTVSYDGNTELQFIAAEYHNAFATAALSEQFKSVPRSGMKKYQGLKVAMMPPADRQLCAVAQVVRIIYDPPNDRRNVVLSRELKRLHRQLIFYIDRLHKTILGPYGTLPQDTKGLIEDPIADWPDIGYRYTDVQEALASYFSGKAENEDAVETACKVVEGYLAKHRVLASPPVFHLRLFGEDIPIAPEVATHGQAPSLAEEHKQRLRLIGYHGKTPLENTAEGFYDEFKTVSASEMLKCTSGPNSKEHPENIPVALLPPSDVAANLRGQAVRIMYVPPLKGRHVVPPADLARLYRQLIFYVDELHKIMLLHYGPFTPATKRSWDKKLFEWIQQQILGDNLSTFPLVGLVDDRICNWHHIIAAGYRYTDVQVKLAQYFSIKSDTNAAVEMAYVVVDSYLAKNKGWYQHHQ